MVSKIELHLRSSAIGQHRCLGIITVEHDRPRLAAHEDIVCWAAGRRIRACITLIQRSGHRLPRVYADEVAARELVG